MASAKANVNVRIDATIKEAAVRLFGLMGMDQTTAIEMFYRQVVAERRLPFQPSVGITLEEQLISALEALPAKEYQLDVDANGSLIIDKDLHPDLYDWAVNG